MFSLYEIGIESNWVNSAGPFTLINPTIIAKSIELISLWDDCMSFPFIMVRKQRHASVSVKFVDDQGKEHIWEVIECVWVKLEACLS